MPTPQITIPKKLIAAWCNKWKVVEFSLFGSVLTKHFHKESDIDVMISFAPNDEWTLFDMVNMQYELEDIFNRKVDLVTRMGVERSQNPFRRKAILDSVETIHVSG